MALPFLNFILSFLIALILHELGHLAAAQISGVRVTALGLGWGPKLYRRTLNNVEFQLRLLPLGAFVQMDMNTFRQRSLNKQLFVLSAGIAVNLLLAMLTWGSLFGVLNLGLAIGNSLPLYQQDGWKCGMVMLRAMLRQKSPIVEWTFTVAGTILSLAVIGGEVLRRFQ